MRLSRLKLGVYRGAIALIKALSVAGILAATYSTIFYYFFPPFFFAFLMSFLVTSRGFLMCQIAAVPLHFENKATALQFNSSLCDLKRYQRIA